MPMNSRKNKLWSIHTLCNTKYKYELRPNATSWMIYKHIMLKEHTQKSMILFIRISKLISADRHGTANYLGRWGAGTMASDWMEA